MLGFGRFVMFAQGRGREIARGSGVFGQIGAAGVALVGISRAWGLRFGMSAIGTSQADAPQRCAPARPGGSNQRNQPIESAAPSTTKLNLCTREPDRGAIPKRTAMIVYGDATR